MFFNAGSAGGPTGLRPQHVKDALSPSANEAGNNLLSHLTDYINLLLTGNIPALIKPVVSSATLITLAKKCGGIRPIAIGNSLRRLTSKCISRRMLEKFKDYFWPFQLGAGVKHGSEAAAHVARDFIECAERDQAFVKIDFANAFNSVRRDVILKAEILSFVNFCYEDVMSFWKRRSLALWNSATKTAVSWYMVPSPSNQQKGFSKAIHWLRLAFVLSYILLCRTSWASWKLDTWMTLLLLMNGAPLSMIFWASNKHVRNLVCFWVRRKARWPFLGAVKRR